MKMNMPQDEARQCVEKVRERQMGYWFENMEKMDIQAERRNTEEARRETEEARKATEEAIKTVILVGQQYGASQEALVDTLVENCNLQHAVAEEKVKAYW